MQCGHVCCLLLWASAIASESACSFRIIASESVLDLWGQYGRVRLSGASFEFVHHLVEFLVVTSRYLMVSRLPRPTSVLHAVSLNQSQSYSITQTSLSILITFSATVLLVAPAFEACPRLFFHCRHMTSCFGCEAASKMHLLRLDPIQFPLLAARFGDKRRLCSLWRPPEVFGLGVVFVSCFVWRCSMFDQLKAVAVVPHLSGEGC